MRKSQIFKYVLPLSIILYYSLTIERIIDDDGTRLLHKTPSFGFPFIQSEHTQFTIVDHHPLGEIGNLLCYFILTFVVFYIARKYITMKDHMVYPVLLWVVCILRFGYHAYHQIHDYRPMDFEFLNNPNNQTWRVVFFNLSY